MSEFDFSSLLTKKPAKRKITTMTKKLSPPDNEKIPFDKLPLDKLDLQILELLSQKYKQEGTNVIRHNQKNPFLHDLSRLAFLVQSIDTFKILFQEGILDKTAYSSQWKIR